MESLFSAPSFDKYSSTLCADSVCGQASDGDDDDAPCGRGDTLLDLNDWTNC